MSRINSQATLRLLIAFFATLGLAFASQAHAGLFKDAVRHPFLTGAVVVAGAAMAHEAAKPACGKGAGSDGMSGSDSGDDRCAGAGEKGSLIDKAELTFLKSSTSKLRKNLAANGEKESKGCAAHHIVPQDENRDWAKNDAEDARGVLESCGIGIDDAINGVYLPFNKDAECEGANHRKLHTKIYYATVSRLLLAAHINSCDQVENQLREIKEALRRNTFIGGVQ